MVDSDHESVISFPFSDDKGGEHMKFHFEKICNQSIVSVYDVHIFAIFKGSDCAENMGKVIAPFQTVLQEIQADGFCLVIELRFFWGAIFVFRVLCLGYQGISSTFPCVKWDIMSWDKTSYVK